MQLLIALESEYTDAESIHRVRLYLTEVMKFTKIMSQNHTISLKIMVILSGGVVGV